MNEAIVLLGITINAPSIKQVSIDIEIIGLKVHLGWCKDFLEKGGDTGSQ